jgi:hypothetical protein
MKVTRKDFGSWPRFAFTGLECVLTVNKEPICQSTDSRTSVSTH